MGFFPSLWMNSFIALKASIWFSFNLELMQKLAVSTKEPFFLSFVLIDFYMRSQGMKGSIGCGMLELKRPSRVIHPQFTREEIVFLFLMKICLVCVVSLWSWSSLLKKRIYMQYCPLLPVSLLMYSAHGS